MRSGAPRGKRITPITDRNRLETNAAVGKSSAGIGNVTKRRSEMKIAEIVTKMR
jgi:hypothetical protein